MTAVLLNLMCAVCLVLFGIMLFNAFLRLPGKTTENQSPSMEYYLFKIARVTGKSEYDVFCKSAEEWPVSKAQIDQDFKIYLQHQQVPHYVNHFVRKNKKHIDELHLPRF